ncbi:DUF4870 domain-containing protein [Flavobacterium sp. NRK F10]|uniref:DUF4870 domain-containing protein n=1 Tax=Flavobacterium sediminis TaxID=2201181 RepID=A0A2U8QWX0_9FLAO|nr:MULTISPECIES: DUF4870 domain-containing protein [Flavobacterium]AWM14356.1 DUF4870 domain-containing protein [Flavobacterium sediminis]MCO6175577.1 DUF4870 domain-containing protein [Flavobacterium sp. NRK F10]
MATSNEKNTSTLLQLSLLSQYCIPFGNFIFPLLIWSSKRQESQFVDKHGKQALNFQLSILLYSLIFVLIAIPTAVFWLYNLLKTVDFNEHHIEINNLISSQNISGLIILGLVAILLTAIIKIFEFILIIYAAYKAANGQEVSYPLTIKFIK